MRGFLSEVNKEYSLRGGDFLRDERPVMEAYVEELATWFFDDRSANEGKAKVGCSTVEP
jgi:hypothetical protein